MERRGHDTQQEMHTGCWMYPVVLLCSFLLPELLIFRCHVFPHAANDALNFPAKTFSIYYHVHCPHGLSAPGRAALMHMMCADVPGHLARPRSVCLNAVSTVHGIRTCSMQYTHR